MIRVVIADDEPPARQQVREFLGAEAAVSIVAECESGTDAANQIRILQPDLLFMDICMPGISGIDVLRTPGLAHLPYTIFVTAYAHYAVDAFAVEALDYLVKPLQQSRFHEAVSRARRFLERDASLSRRTDFLAVERYVAELQKTIAQRDRVAVKIGRSTHLLQQADIVFIEAEGDYVSIHAQDGRQSRVRESITAIEARLHAGYFARVHRSLIVNMRCVKELRSNKRGGYVLVMSDGSRLSCSALYQGNISAWLAGGSEGQGSV
jgi:two-component system, LytTR family, response regulator